MSLLKQRTIYMGERVPASIVLDDGRLEVRRVNVDLLSLQDSDSDSEGSVQVSGIRKRKRLTNLTQEEKLMRRKLKNRMAAQSARDRKKQKMVELEEALAIMEAENRKLLEENHNLKNSTSHLTRENQILKGKLHTSEPIVNASASLATTVGSISHSFSTSLDNQFYVKMESQVEEEVVTDVCSEVGAVHTGSFSEPLPESAELSPQQKEATRTIISLVTAVYLQTTILAVCLVYSWLSTVKSVCSSSVVQVKQEKENSSHQMMISSLSPPIEPLLPQWWGSHQKSWNPSMNS